MLPSLNQFMILYKACKKVFCKILLPCWFKCNLLLFMSVGFILFEWSNNEKFFSLHSLGKCAFTYFALVWRWSFRGIMLKTATCFWVLRVITISVINFSIISSERSKSRSFAPTCHTKWPGFCLSDGFAWSFRYFSYLRSRKSFDIYNALFTFSAISHLFTCFIILLPLLSFSTLIFRVFWSLVSVSLELPDLLSWRCFSGFVGKLWLKFGRIYRALYLSPSPFSLVGTRRLWYHPAYIQSC